MFGTQVCMVRYSPQIDSINYVRPTRKLDRSQCIPINIFSSYPNNYLTTTFIVSMVLAKGCPRPHPLQYLLQKFLLCIVPHPICIYMVQFVSTIPKFIKASLKMVIMTGGKYIYSLLQEVSS